MPTHCSRVAHTVGLLTVAIAKDARFRSDILRVKTTLFRSSPVFATRYLLSLGWRLNDSRAGLSLFMPLTISGMSPQARQSSTTVENPSVTDTEVQSSTCENTTA